MSVINDLALLMAKCAQVSAFAVSLGGTT